MQNVPMIMGSNSRTTWHTIHQLPGLVKAQLKYQLRDSTFQKWSVTLQAQYLTGSETIIQNNILSNVPKRKKYMAWELKGRSKHGFIYHYH